MASYNLTLKQKKRIKNGVESGNFDFKKEINYLTKDGLSEQDAVVKITEELENIKRQKLFDQKVNSENVEERGKVAWFVIVLLGIIGPIFEVTSPIWYIVCAIIAGGVCYWAYPRTPFAGLIGGVFAISLLPFTYSWYLSGRHTIIKIEMIIPILMAFIPAYLIGIIIAKVFYSNKN